MAFSDFPNFEISETIIYIKKYIWEKIPLKMFLDKTGISVIEGIQMSLARNFQLNIYKNYSYAILHFIIRIGTDNK